MPTIGNFTDIEDDEVDAESPITESLATRWRDNAYWVGETEQKTSEMNADRFLKPDGSGGLEWGNTDTLGVDKTKGSGLASSFSGTPTAIAEIENRMLVVIVNGLESGTNGNYQVQITIDQSDDSYSAVSFCNVNSGNDEINSGNGTLTGSFTNVGTTTGDVQFRKNGTDYEFYENATGPARYLYYWL